MQLEQQTRLRTIEPVTAGLHPLAALTRDMPGVMERVVERTRSQLGRNPKIGAEEAVRDAIFWERKRLDTSRDSIRDPGDRQFWREISSEFLGDTRPGNGSVTADLGALSEKIIRYHTNEIAGNFNERVYRIATVAVPHGLSWMLQALSWKSFRNIFSEKIDLRRKIHLEGQIEQMRRLSELGTVILVPTHFSNLDSILVGWAISELGLPPFCYGAGLNLFTNPIFGYFMNNLGAYKVDRRKKHLIYKQTLKNYSTVILERGCHSLFFPGGGRSRSGGLEHHLKLGLLGTTIDAYVENLLSGKPKPRFFIVPCVISYHFVLEAATLIDDYLSEHGKSRYIIEDDESAKPRVMLQFLYKFFKTSSSIYLNFGRALDPFGNFVDEDGMSLSPHGHRIDPASYVRSNGVVCHSPQRDQEYTRLLGERLVERYREENIALSSHFVAYAYFELLRRKYGLPDFFRVFRLAEPETVVTYEEFAAIAEPMLARLHGLYNQGRLQLEPVLRSKDLRQILDSAQRNMGVFHTRRPIKVLQDGTGRYVATEDVKLLFYYRNRMLGYDLRGEPDSSEA